MTKADKIVEKVKKHIAKDIATGGKINIVVEPPKRKVIQIASQISSVGSYIILAVCNDGTIWTLNNLYREHGEPRWVRFISPPQD